jgi:hypothetical protein
MASLLLFMAVPFAASVADRSVTPFAGRFDACSIVRVLPLDSATSAFSEGLPYCHRRMLRWPIRAKLESDHEVRSTGSGSRLLLASLAEAGTEPARSPSPGTQLRLVPSATANDLIYFLQKLTI